MWLGVPRGPVSRVVPFFRLGEAPGKVADVLGGDQVAGGGVLVWRQRHVVAGGVAAPDRPSGTLAAEPFQVGVVGSSRRAAFTAAAGDGEPMLTVTYPCQGWRVSERNALRQSRIADRDTHRSQRESVPGAGTDNPEPGRSAAAKTVPGRSGSAS